MNDVPVLGRLEQVDLREAWIHEAHAFTPWLAANLDRLTEAIGIPLELESSEVRVGRFAADILARNRQDGSLVLIENQLGPTDHNHLGQIMTYLAGLDAHTIVWIAREFCEEHLSAIKWLNEHTADPFAFFAVQVKVVRVGDSPLAPVFEVLSRPNEWERRLQTVADDAKPTSARAERRRAFWKRFCERHPEEEARFGPPHSGSNRWHSLDDLELIISLYLATDHVGLFVRGPWGMDGDDAYERLETRKRTLRRRLGTVESITLGQRFDGDAGDPKQRDRMIDWLYDTANKYEAVLREVFGSGG